MVAAVRMRRMAHHHARWHTSARMVHARRQHAAGRAALLLLLLWRWSAQLMVGARRRNGDAPNLWRWCGERILRDLAGLEGGGGGVDQVLRLLLHPLLVVELDVVAVFAAGAVCLAHAGRVVRQVGVTVVAVVLWHGGGGGGRDRLEKSWRFGPVM